MGNHHYCSLSFINRLLLLLLSRFSSRLLCPWDSPGKNTGGGCHFLLQRMKVKSEREVPQLCPTLSNPMDCSLPGSTIHGIFQARVLEWGAIAFSKSRHGQGQNGDFSARLPPSTTPRYTVHQTGSCPNFANYLLGVLLASIPSF